MNKGPILLLDRLTKNVAWIMAACGIALATYLYAHLQTFNLPARFDIERVSEIDAAALDARQNLLLDQITEDTALSAGAFESATESKPLWFRIRISPPQRTDGALVANFNHGLLAPQAVWLVSNPANALDAQNLQFLSTERTVLGRHVQLPAPHSGSIALVARVLSPGIGQPKLTLIYERDLPNAIANITLRTAALTSIFLILTCFSVAVAATSRDTAFLFFAGWLLTSLRLVAVNSGWDLEWIGERLTPEAAGMFFRASLCAYGLFTVAIFRALLQEQLSERWSDRVFTVLQYVYLALVVLAFVLPGRYIYTAAWAISGICIIAIVLESSWIAVTRRDAVAATFLASWILTLSGMAAEIAYYSGVLNRGFSLFNAESGALAGALMCALALAQRLKTEILGRKAASLQALRASREMKRNYDSMPLGLFGCKPNGDLTIFNPAFEKLYLSVTGLRPTIGASNIRPLVGNAGIEQLPSARLGAETSTIVRAGDNEDKDAIWLQLNLKHNNDQLEGSVENISARIEAERTLARLVDHDVLTPALNQRGLNESVSQALIAVRSNQSCSVVALDIDRFKTLNDLHGYLFGDLLLKALYNRISDKLGPKDAIARIGDSFRLVIIDREPHETLELVASIQRAATNRPVEVERKLIAVSTNAGVVALDADMDVRDAIAASSQACADAKRKGPNHRVLFGKQDRALRGYLEELQVQANLQANIDSQRFFLEFQPIVSLRSAFETLNYEVLVRMRGEDGSVIPPGRFIPAAERNGQMSLIDRWVVQSTLRWLDQHREHVKRLGYATINLSGSSLNDARFVDNLFAMIAEFPAVMHKLCFEITETVALADQNATRHFSERVHSMGSRVALDDFGAGYTSFTYLREIDADIIKIDGSFVKDINQNPANHAITRMIVELSHQLGKRCVAEWAEKPDVIATLMQLGVDYGQGFGLARPLSPVSLAEAKSCGELILDPDVKAMLSGHISPEQVASGRHTNIFQPALF